MDGKLRFIEFVGKIKNFFLDIIFPVECLGCRKEGEWLCEECLLKIRPDKHSLSGQSLDRILTFYSYDNEIIKRAIHLLKYKFVEEAAKPLGNLLERGVKDIAGRPDGDTVVMPVPLHKKRFLERGFNQAALLAKILSREFGWQLDCETLKRRKETSSQVSLAETERRGNVRGVFSIGDNLKIIDKKIVLVDDVLTTGSTMEECALTLKSAGAREVWGVALAKG